MNYKMGQLGNKVPFGTLRFRKYSGRIPFCIYVLICWFLIDGRIILRWIFRKWDVGAWTGSSWLRIETGGGHFRMR